MNSLQHRRRLAGCRIGLAILAVSGILGFSATARGTDFLQGEAVTVDAETVYEGDLFVIGQSITISGTVQGDLFVAGETIKVDGKVGGSAHLAGNTIEVAGEVGGSARVAGREIELSSTARVGRDVMAAGEIIRAVVDSEVAGQLYGGGRVIELQGTISKTVFLGCDSATLGGVFESDVNINCSGIQTQPDATGLNIADTATIQGDLLIRTPAPTSVTIAEEATIAGTQDIVEISQADAAPKDPIRAYVRTWLVTWLQLGLLGLAFDLCFLVAPRSIYRICNACRFWLLSWVQSIGS